LVFHDLATIKTEPNLFQPPFTPPPAGAYSERLAVEHLQLLILPVLQGALDANDSSLVDAPLAERLLREALKVLGPAGSAGGANAGDGDGRDGSPAPAFGSLVYGEPLRVRLCQLATLLLRVSRGLALIAVALARLLGLRFESQGYTMRLVLMHINRI
jgi:hypothetical protein